MIPGIQDDLGQTLTSFVLLADCTALYVHGMNILHLSEVTDVIKPRLAIEAIILVIEFSMLIGVAMPFLLIFANLTVTETIGRSWIRFEIWFNPDGQRFRPDSAYSVPIYELRKKAHASKESYYLNLLKEADEDENEHWYQMRQTALFAFTVLVLSGVNLFAPLSPNGPGILAQIADGLGQNGYGWLFCLGCLLVALAFYPVFEDRRKMLQCPELAGELEEKRLQEREQQERFRREAEKLRAAPPPPLADIGGPLSRSMPPDSFTPPKAQRLKRLF